MISRSSGPVSGVHVEVDEAARVNAPMKPDSKDVSHGRLGPIEFQALAGGAAEILGPGHERVELVTKKRPANADLF